MTCGTCPVNDYRNVLFEPFNSPSPTENKVHCWNVRGMIHGRTHSWMQHINLSTSAKPVLTQLKSLLIVIIDTEILPMNKISFIHYWLIGVICIRNIIFKFKVCRMWNSSTFESALYKSMCTSGVLAHHLPAAVYQPPECSHASVTCTLMCVSDKKCAKTFYIFHEFFIDNHCKPI